MTPEVLKKANKLIRKINEYEAKIQLIEDVSNEEKTLLVRHTKGVIDFYLPTSMVDSIVGQCLLRMKYDLEQLENEFKNL